jgi:hypothetical protein
VILVFNKRSEYNVALEIADDEGNTQFQILVNRFKIKDAQFLAKLWGTEVPKVVDVLNRVCDGEEVEPVEFSPDPALIESMLGDTVETAPTETVSTDSFSVFVREQSQPRKHASAYTDVEPGEALRRAFTETPLELTEPLIEWHDRNVLCCMDVDYHTIPDAERLSPEQCERLVAAIRPQPFAWHPSHAGGCKLYYLAKPGFTATELASVAGIHWLQLDRRATFDLIKSTRHPSFVRLRDNKPAVCTPDNITYTYGSSDLVPVRRLLTATLDFEEVSEFLAERGWTLGQMLPHSNCQIDPTGDTPSDKENVYVGEQGLFCHRCSARGYQNGFTSYVSMIGGHDSKLTTMVRNFCHFEHAGIILSNLYPAISQKILQEVYRVMLKIVHQPDDPRIPLAMNAGKGWIRSRGTWVSVDGETVLADAQNVFVNSLPATRYPASDGDGECKLVSDVPKTVAFMNAGNLEHLGYPDIDFIRGCKIYGQFLPYRQDENIKVIIRREFRNTVPTYVAPSARMPIEEAWQLLESEFKGIERNYVKLLICAKGASEGRLAQCPFLLVNGPSGAGKSTTVHIAAGICGDKAEEPIWVKHIDRFRQSLMDSARDSGFICINEIFKYAEASHTSYTQALDPMLSLTEDSRSHVLYVGSVPFGRLPVFVVTDVNTPPEVQADIQLARRFTFFELSNRNYWEDNIVAKGIRPHEFRKISYEHNAAADSILSDIIDTFFKEPTPLAHMARQLQSGVLSDYTEDVDRKSDRLLQFYNEAIKAPLLTGSHAQRYTPAMGWKLISRAELSPLIELWGDICDGEEPERWVRSRAVAAADWQKVIGTKFPVLCEIRPYRTNIVYVRFRSKDSTRTPKWINGVERS